MGDGARYFWRRVAASRRVTRWRDVPKLVRRIDIRKPFHAVMVGLVLAGILAPVADWLATNERYRMTHETALVAERPSPHLMNKLRYDASKRANVFNAEGQVDVKADMKDKLQASVGAGGKKDKQLYTATMPDDPTQGVDIHDNVNDVSVKFVPQTGLLNGRSKDGRVIYPLKDQAGQMVFTPKANGVKEDIVLTQAPKDDAMDVHYRLDIPDAVQARLDEDGSVGFYTASPELFGDITYGTDKDRDLVDKARKNSAKTYLMFRIPAPVVRETGKRSVVQARFELQGNDLVVRATGLAKAHYPLSIDPTFLLTSTADFVLGSGDDNIDLSVAGQVGRAVLSGGSTPNWGPNGPSLTNGNYSAGLVAYNSALYLIGGGNTDTGTTNTTTTQVMYVKLNSDGTANGTWTTTSSLNTARQGLAAFGFNGYLYAVGGDNTSAAPLSSVEYAKINSDSSVGSWTTLSSTPLNHARGYPAGAIYQGVMYVMGGANGTMNASLLNTIEYARINGDGTIGSWTESTSSATGNLTSARDRFTGGAYNGFVYIAGGLTSTPSVLNTVEYAPILSDGSLGAWASTTAFPTARRDHGMGVINGHIYIYAGCASATFTCPTLQSDTEYAVINADGTVGRWQRTGDYTYNATTPGSPFGARVDPSSAFYNGFLYFVGGCNAEASSSNIHCTSGGLRVGTFYTDFDDPGRFDKGIQSVQTTPPYNSNAATVARMGAQGVALNGYMYLIGGCSTASCNTATSYSSVVEYAPLNADGSLGTFATTSALITTDTTNNNAGRHGLAVVAYNDKVYVIGGIDRTKANGDSYRAEVLSATQNSNGTLGTWAAEANSLPAARAFGTAVVWHNWIYYLGGLSNATTVTTTIYHAQITNDAPGSWTATTTSLAHARWGQSGGIWGNWIYVTGGQSDTSGTYVTAANGVEQLTIANSGDITAASSTQNPSGQPLSRLAGGFVHNGYIYVFGGYRSGSTSASLIINWSRLDPVSGNLGAWSATNIGNAKTGSTTPTYGLGTARGVTTAVASGGTAYIMGGCTATLAATSFGACTTFVTTTNTTEADLINNGGSGQTSAFTTGSSNIVDLPTVSGTAGRADHAAVAYNGKLYIIGGCRVYTAGACTTELGDIQRADIGNDGTVTGSWTAQTSLPGGEVRSLLRAVAYNGYLYVVGGQSASANATASVWYTTIDNTGTLGGAWSNASNALGNDLPVARRDFGMAISAGYLYVVGGEDATPTKQNTVYYATVNSDGTLGSWNTTNAFTTARSAFGFVAYNGVLYVIGGTDGSNNLTDIQYAAQSNVSGAFDGTVSSWSYATDVPRGMVARQAAAANGYMYFIGDEGANTDITYADINANGTLGTIQRSANTMNGAHAHGAAVIFDGTLYDTGGCTLSGGTCSTVSAANDKGGQLAVSRTGHYSKLYDTQVDTSPTQLVINGANNGPGAAVEFKFQSASQSDPVLGVAQLIRPVVFGNFYTVQALNSSGTNVGVAKLYLFLITLDDSRSSTFPDVPNNGTGFAQTAVTDITLNYHANPGRRLRHGASFTDTGCNPTPSEGCLLDTAP